MPSLRELEAEFLVCGKPDGTSWRRQESAVGAQGILFICPGCAGGHAVVVWFLNPIGASAAPPPFTPVARWQREGDSLDNLTLRPSLNADHKQWYPCQQQPCNDCHWHGYVTNGIAS